MLVGLNPYGLCCSFGFIGKGTERGVSRALTLEEFIAMAEEMGARCLELDLRLLQGQETKPIRERLAAAGMVAVIAAGMPGDHLSMAFHIAAALGCKLIRLHMTTVLCGDRASRPDWNEAVQQSRTMLKKWAPEAAANGIDIAIEDHQDLDSSELLEYAEEAGPNVGICLDTGNPLAVAEDILPFTLRVKDQVKHVHLKDYRVQFTEEGYRLVSCPVGDGCVPFEAISEMLGDRPITASLEPGALEARHVRLFTETWWNGYPPRDAREFAGALKTVQKNRIRESVSWQSPWERNEKGDEIAAYERQVVNKSAQNMKALGWL